MTATTEPRELALPVLSGQIQIGPAEYIGGEVMHQAKHNGTGRYFRMGDREAFLLTHLDGRHTLDSIAEKYRSQFGKAIHAGSLESALRLFARHGLFEAELEAIQADSPEPAPFAGTNELDPFSGKIWFFSPDRLVAMIAPWFKWLINGPMFVAWALLAIAAETLVFERWHGLWAEFAGQPASSLLMRGVWLALFSFGVMVLHEFGHAVACKRYGGQVPEMGLLFRYFTVCAYTRIDDILLFPNRLHRVYVLMIGPLISLTFIPLALAIWLQTPPGAALHTLAGDTLIWYNGGVLLQLIPFLQFDGYFMLAQLLRMPNLRKDASRFLVSGLMTRLNSKSKPMPMSTACPRYVPAVYAVYGVSSTLVTCAALIFLFAQYGRSMVQMIGFVPSIVVASLLGVVVLRKLYTVTLPWVLENYGSKPKSYAAAKD